MLHLFSKTKRANRKLADEIIKLINSNMDAAKDYMSSHGLSSSLTFDIIICGYVYGLADCLALERKFRDEQPKVFDAAWLVLEAMGVAEYSEAKEAESQLLNNEPNIRYGYDAAKRDFEIFKQGWEMPLSIGRYVVFGQNAAAFNWDKSTPEYVLEQTIAETDFIIGNVNEEVSGLTEEEKKTAGMVCLNFGFQLEAIFDQIDTVEFSSLKIWPFDKWIAGFLWGELMVASGEIAHLHAGAHDTEVEMILDPELIQYTYVSLYTEQGFVFWGQYNDWIKTSANQFEKSVKAGITHMSRKASDNNHVSKPLRQHILQTYS